MINEMFVRRGDGPLLTPEDMPIPANAVLNPGVALVDDEIVLLLRIEDRRGVSEIRVARSEDGIGNWRIAPTPLLQPDLPDWPYEEWGCEDARVTQIGPREWIIAYTAYSRYGPAVALATTTDFETVTRIGTVLSPTNKDATIFPEQFDGRWMMLHRPVTGGQEHIWYATSNGDLVHWSLPGVLIPERGGPWWDGLRIGCGAPPIRTDDGWLLIYHGVKDMSNRGIYRLGLALLDLEDPRKVLARADEWVFTPQTPYELQGLVPSVVYTCGAVCRGDHIWMYYGAADTVVGLATARTQDLVDFAKEHNYLDRVRHSKGTI